MRIRDNGAICLSLKNNLFNENIITELSISVIVV